MNTRFVWSSLALIFLAFTQTAASCSRTVENANGCAKDGDCPSFFVCEESTGFCLCDGDNACDDNEFCNDSGRCQVRTGCVSNTDCQSDDRPQDICDTVSGECLTLNASTLQCTLDSHCPFGAYCQSGVCQPGCRENGDCPLGQPCISGQCDARPSACNENQFCEYGQYCNLSTNSCVNHPDANRLCQWCDPYDPIACGGNSCLFDSTVPAGNSCNTDAQCGQWPGAVCSTAPCYSNADCPGGSACNGATSFFGQNFPGTCATGSCSRGFCGSNECNDDTDPCPRGYSCYQLISVTGSPCTLNGNQCQGGRACQVGGENNVSGFCSCISDEDCGGLLSGLTCSNPGPEGICISGTTCGPSSGLLCEDLR